MTRWEGEGVRSGVGIFVKEGMVWCASVGFSVLI